MRNYAWSSSRRPWLMASAALFAVVMLITPAKAEAISAGTLISLTNNQRVQAGLVPLSYNGSLASSAYAKAQDMLAKGYWAHTSPDGLSPWTFVSSAGYNYVVVGENLAKDFSSDAGVMAAWMASPGHRANVLKPEFRDVGIAVVSGSLSGSPTTLVVAHYGARSVQSAPAPAPKPASAPAPAPARAAAPVSRQPVQAQVSQPVTETAAKPADVPASPEVKVQADEKKTLPKSPLSELLERLAEMLENDRKSLV